MRGREEEGREKLSWAGRGRTHLLVTAVQDSRAGMNGRSRQGEGRERFADDSNRYRGGQLGIGFTVQTRAGLGRGIAYRFQATIPDTPK